MVHALRALVTEITIIAIYAADLRAGRVPDHREHERFLGACSAIAQAEGTAMANEGRSHSEMAHEIFSLIKNR